eukprot:3335773-Prymnesium_polylepis.2
MHRTRYVLRAPSGASTCRVFPTAHSKAHTYTWQGWPNSRTLTLPSPPAKTRNTSVGQDPNAFLHAVPGARLRVRSARQSVPGREPSKGCETAHWREA